MSTAEGKIDISLEEDRIWEKIAEERDVKNARFVSHSQAWQ